MKRLFWLTLFVCTSAFADVSFFDNFNSGPSASWSNTYGNWTSTGGV